MSDVRCTDHSPLPAAARSADEHRHPLSRRGIGALLALGLLQGVVLLAVLGVVLVVRNQGDSTDRRTRALIDERTSQRLKNERAQQRQLDAQQARTRRAVCLVLADSLRPSTGTRQLALELRCALPAPPAAGPSAPGPTQPPPPPEAPRTGPALRRSPPAPASAPPPRSPPAPPSSAQPSPSSGSSAACRVRVPLTDTCLT